MTADVHPSCRAAILADLDAALHAEADHLLTLADTNRRNGHTAQAETCRRKVEGIGHARAAIREMGRGA